MGFNDLNNGSGPSVSGYGPVAEIFSRHLDTDGDGTGTKNAIGDYSSTPEIFYIQPAATQIFRVYRMLVLIRGPKAKFLTDNYGSRIQLTNGIIIRTQDDSGTLINLSDDVPIRTNGNWARMCFDSFIYEAGSGGTDTYLRVRWTFSQAGYPIRLNGANNERLEIVLNDDFTLNTSGSDPLVEHYYVAQGYIENST